MTGAIGLPYHDGKPLAGWRVLVPRGGPWGDGVAAALRARGATPVVAPMINFAPTDDQPALEAALAKLAAGEFDWLTVTSATTVDVLSSYGAVIPETTKVAAVGETTAAALVAAGYHADIVPSEDNAASGDRETGALGRPRPHRPPRPGGRRLPHDRRPRRAEGRRRCARGPRRRR